MRDVVSIVAGGWSVLGIALDRLPGKVIAVNDAAIRAPVVDVVVSMDRLWSENRFADLDRMGKTAWIRDAAVKNVPQRPWLNTFVGDINQTEMSEEWGRLHGDNSGRCALNLAYLMNPDEVYLFGFDMQKGPNGEAYWFDPYPWARLEGGTSPRRYEEWRARFHVAASQFREAGIKVTNVSSRTALAAFPVKHPSELGLAA